MSVTEADFTIDFPEIAKDVESAPVKRKLIEPVAAANKAVKRNARRYSGEKLAQKHGDDIPVTAPVAAFIAFEKRFTRAVFSILHYLGQWW